jgi:ERCC4-type nuclease
MGATAIMVDQREIDWIKKLTFGGLPTSVTLLDTGDAWLSCNDGALVLVEHKSVDDLLGSIKDGRLFNQVAEMTTKTRWAYLVITDTLQRGPNGTLITARGPTGWDFNSVWGALLTVQELGCFVICCAGDQDYEACLLRLANKSHNSEHIIEPVKMPHILSIQEQIIVSLPGIGIERLRVVMETFPTPALAIAGLTDPDSEIIGIQKGIKAKIRNALKLAEGEQLIVTTNQDDEEIVEIVKTYV